LVPHGTGNAATKAAFASSAPGEAAEHVASAPILADAAATATLASDPALFAALAAVLAAAGARDAAAAAADEAPADDAPVGPRLVVGPVRSGRIVDHVGHLIVVGDVNPGAEVRAEGSIIVLGRLRGVAHAAIGRDKGCIIALSLQPQQLRIGRMVARAGDADRPGGGAEIAYVTGETIVVERFSGRLPSGLAASM
jgi:septum site-determining protein MinC